MVNVDLGVTGIEFCDEVWALVPARSGSKGVVDKNLQEIQGVSLLGLAVLSGTNSPSIDRCFVSTDSASYADEARKYGAEVPFLRPAEISMDASTDLDVFRHFFDWAVSTHNRLPWAMVHLRPTTPCREPGRITEVVSLAREHRDKASAIRSVHVAPESPFKWFLRDADGFLTTFEGSRSLDASNRGRAEFQDVLVPNGYVDVVFPRNVLSSGLLHGDAVLPFLTEQTIEVDSIFELEVLRAAQSVPPVLLAAASKVLSSANLANVKGRPAS